jgi:DNA (cytosine-5)-methyltransferase 1
MPSAVSLFTGCGGSDTGLHAAGFDIIMANDVLPYASEVYQANLPETDYKICKIEQLEKFPKAELLVGCYPCQGFSQGGVRNAGRHINYLYREFDRVLRLIKPKAFIVENVSGMKRSNYSHLLKNQLIRFRTAGYRVKFSELNSEEFGVPQSRKRVFFVGIRSDIKVEYNFPTPTHGGLNNPLVTIGDALKDMPDWPEGEYYNLDFHWYYMSRNRRNDWSQTSKTIVANPRHMPLHPISPELKKKCHNVWEFTSNDRARRFSYREAAKLQGFSNLDFPDSEKGSLEMRYKVVGNAVPPQLFEAVARELPDIWD